MSYYQFTVEHGVRNDVGPERFAVGDMLYGRNVDLDESGKIQRRKGSSLVQAGAAYSAWGAGGNEGFFVQGGYLKRFLADGSISQLTAISGARVCYADINGETYWSDGVSKGIVKSGVNHSFGIDPPSPIYPQAALGNLPAGAYLCTMTFVDRNGIESGAPKSIAITMDVGGALYFSSLPVSSNPDVVGRNLYVSAPNGELPMLTAALDNSATSTTIYELPEQSIPVRTQFMGPPPAGQLLGYNNGYCFVGWKNFLFYSRPFEYELFDLRSGFLAFSSGVQTFAPVKDGIFIGTKDKTVFLRGVNPEEFVQVPVFPYGGVLGTEKKVRPDALDSSLGIGNEAVLWMSRWGVVVGQEGGVAKNLTAARYIPPETDSGGSILKWRDGTPQFLISLFK